MKHHNERTVLIWMCVLIGVNQLGFGAIIPVLPLYAESFGVSQAAIGMTVAVYGVARLVIALPSGRIADWLGRRSTLAIGGLVSGVGNLWCAYAASYDELVVARFVAGAGAGLTLTAGTIVLADITSIERRGRVMAIYQGVFLFAVGIGPFPGGYLAETFSLSTPFFAYSLASFIAAAVGWWAVAETRPNISRESDAEARPTYLTALRTILMSRGFLLVGAISFTGALVRTGGLFSIVPLVGTRQLSLTATEIGFAMAIGSLLGVMITYPTGVMVDRLGRKTVIVPATIATGFAFMLYSFAPSYIWFLAACAVWGIASAASGSAPAAYAADIAPRENAATAMSAYRTISDAGYVIGPILLGVIADLFGMTTALITASGMLIAIALLFAARAPETYRAG